MAGVGLSGKEEEREWPVISCRLAVKNLRQSAKSADEEESPGSTKWGNLTRSHGDHEVPNTRGQNLFFVASCLCVREALDSEETA